MAISDFFESIINAFKAFFEKVKGIIKSIIAKIVNFAEQIKKWFKNLSLIKGRHIPFLTKKNEFREMLKKAPVKNIGIFEGVYDEQTDEITEVRYIAADAIDEETRNVMGNQELVVLS
jgi:hypothetical protein